MAAIGEWVQAHPTVAIGGAIGAGLAIAFIARSGGGSTKKQADVVNFPATQAVNQGYLTADDLQAALDKLTADLEAEIQAGNTSTVTGVLPYGEPGNDSGPGGEGEPGGHGGTQLCPHGQVRNAAGVCVPRSGEGGGFGPSRGCRRGFVFSPMLGICIPELIPSPRGYKSVRVQSVGMGGGAATDSGPTGTTRAEASLQRDASIQAARARIASYLDGWGS